MGGGSNSGKVGASEALSLVFRIATVGLSLASAITTAASTQSQCVHEDCNGEATATVSFGNYNSFKYSALADLLSAVLQGVAICLEVARKDKAAKVVELIDKLLLALSTQAGRFCGKIRASSALSLVAAVSVSVTVYTRHIPGGLLYMVLQLFRCAAGHPILYGLEALSFSDLTAPVQGVDMWASHLLVPHVVHQKVLAPHVIHPKADAISHGSCLWLGM
uniref:CASP-like protein n=1 Tax=Aegilops tauschii TaxID=37682 RepID=M8AYZ9_AEGTA